MSNVNRASSVNRVNQTSLTATGWMSTTTMPIRFLAWVAASVAAAIRVKAVRAWVVPVPVALKAIRGRVVLAPVAARVFRVRVALAKAARRKGKAVRVRGVQAKAVLPARVFKARAGRVKGAKAGQARAVRAMRVARKDVLRDKASRVRPMVGRTRRGAKAPGAVASQIRCKRRLVLPIPVRAATLRVRARGVPAKAKVVPSRAVRLRRAQAWIKACRAGAAKADGVPGPGSIGGDGASNWRDRNPD